MQQGLDTAFDPRKLGIETATFWEVRADKQLEGVASGEPSEK